MDQSTLTQKIKILERDISEIKRYLGLGVSKERANFKIDFKKLAKDRKNCEKNPKRTFQRKISPIICKAQKEKIKKG